MTKSPPLKKVWQSICAGKKYWVAFSVLALILTGLVIYFTRTSADAPFVYTIF